MNDTIQRGPLAQMNAELARRKDGAGCSCTYPFDELVIDEELRTIRCPECDVTLPLFDVVMWLLSERDELDAALFDEEFEEPS